jgi:hypothetical protein
MSIESEEVLKTIKGHATIHIPSFEKFLRKWIDNDRLNYILQFNASIGGIINFAGITSKLPPGLPEIKSLLSFFNEPVSTQQIHMLCNYTDHLLDYVIYIFKFYEYKFKMDGNRIDKTDEDNILLAKRITKIYKIISNYIIGNPDLSIKEEREKIKYKPKHRKIFKIAQDKTMVQSISETFGLSRAESQETDYNDSQRSGGTRKLRRYNNRKTVRLSFLMP